MRSAHITAMRDGSLSFQSPYDPDLVAALKARIPYSDRKWDREQKVWLVAPAHGQILADLAEQYLGARPRVPTIRVQVANTTQLLKVMYLGAAKDRGSGEQSSYGWANGGWTTIFPLDVLKTWFSVDTKPEEAPTLYAVLGVKRTVNPSDLKSAYRRAARQWHPDVNSDPDAKEQFILIQRAYEVLNDPLKRRKYDAGLQLASSIGKGEQSLGNAFTKLSYGWRPPLRCGYILCEGQEQLGRFVVSRILQWEDIVNSRGQVLVTSWRYGDDSFTERWV